MTTVMEPTVRERRTIAGDPLRRFVLVCVALAFVVITIGTINVSHSDPFSRLDEPTHADYVWKISHGVIPERGSLISPEILETWSCLGQYRTEVPACGTTTDNAEFPYRGENYNFIHPFGYYGITAIAVAGIQFVAPGVSFFDAARWSSILWTLAGMILLYYGMRVLRVPWLVAAATAAGVLAWSPVLTGATIVNNDAPSLLAAALALIFLGRVFVRGRCGFLFPLLATFFITNTKIISVMAMLVAALVVFIAGIHRLVTKRDRDSGRLILAAIVVPVTTAAMFVGWSWFQDQRGATNWTNPLLGYSSRPIDGSPVDEWFSTGLNGFMNFTVGYVSPSINVGLVEFTTALLAVLGVAAAFVVVVYERRGTGRFAVAATVLLGLLLYPWIVQAQVFVNTGGTDYFPNPTARYGLTIDVLMIVCLAFVAERARLQRLYVAGMSIALVMTLIGVVIGN